MSIVLIAFTWVPRSAKGWIIFPGAALVMTAFVVVTVRGARQLQSARGDVKPEVRRRVGMLLAMVFAAVFIVPTAVGVIVGVMTHSFIWGWSAAGFTAAPVMLIFAPVFVLVRGLISRHRKTLARNTSS